MDILTTIKHQGCPLAYEVRGDGPPVLLIQGAAVHGGGWQPQVDGLASRYRCLSFDNRGMGRSQPVGAPLTIEQMAEDAQALMDAQGWDSAHVVGHSMGGLIALHLALTARKRVRSLSLLCTFARGRDATRLSLWMLWVGIRSRLGPRRLRRRAFLQMVMPPDLLAKSDQDALAERLAPIFGHDLGDQPPVTMKQLSAMGAYDATPRLSELTGLPTLVVSAAHDRIAQPEYGRALAAGVPGARYVEIAEASHGVTVQCAGRINALLLEHLAQADGVDTQRKSAGSNEPDQSAFKHPFLKNLPQPLLVSMRLDAVDALLTDWRWLIGNDKESILLAASGDVFLKDAGGKILWLETGGGTLAEVAGSIAEFEAALADPNKLTEWLLEPVIGRLRQSGTILAAGQCYGFVVLPVMGGAYDGENRCPVSVREHLGLTGHLHYKLKDLPDGAQVTIKWTD